jgi:hypothetical protein
LLGVVTGATERGLPPLPQAAEVGLRRRMTMNSLMKMVIGLVEKRKQEAELLKEGAGRVREKRG